ncbi:hypothetical protein AB4Y67_18565 [Arthrobacter sp. YAF17]|uniref:hypothetical protein n=1 Tax=Arthrobacter sp. YAF17 TaxID=3233077 RepID=UPI003F8E489B
MSYRNGMVLDTSQLDRLAVELDSRSYAVGFVCRFVSHLPDKLTRIHQNLIEGKSDGALAAIRSVATSAAMAGAVQLETQSRAVEQCIRAGNLEAALAAAGGLDSNAADFARHLDALLGSSGPAPARTHPES